MGKGTNEYNGDEDSIAYDYEELQDGYIDYLVDIAESAKDDE